MSATTTTECAISAAEVNAYVCCLCEEGATVASGSVGAVSSPSACGSFTPALTVEYLLQHVFSDLFGDKNQPFLPDRMPFALKQVPSLLDVAARQARITARVCAAVATRPVVTIYELQEEICLEEGVERFGELGFGSGLQSLPIVQQYFGVKPTTKVLPVTSRQVMDFVVSRPEARLILDSCGDARDLVNSFRSYYEAHIMPRLGTSRAFFTPEGLPPQKAPHMTNIWQLGIHLQSLQWLLGTLRQEADRVVSRVLEETIESAKTRVAQNKNFYVEAVRAMDAALIKHSPSFESSSLCFSVHMTLEAARMTTVPPALWTDPSSTPGDGYGLGDVALPMCLGHRSGDWLKGGSLCQAGGDVGHCDIQESTAPMEAGAANRSQPPHTTLSQPTAATHALRRRRRGELISDTSNTLLQDEAELHSGSHGYVDTSSSMAFSVSTLSQSLAHSHTTHSTADDKKSTSSIAGKIGILTERPSASIEAKGTAQNVDQSSSLRERLDEAIKHDAKHAEEAGFTATRRRSCAEWIELLRQIRPGMQLPRALLVSSFEGLAKAMDAEKHRQLLLNSSGMDPVGRAVGLPDQTEVVAFIPIFRSGQPLVRGSAQPLHLSLTPAATSVEIDWVEVIELACPLEVCWETLDKPLGGAPARSLTSDHGESPGAAVDISLLRCFNLFHASLRALYGDALKPFFCGTLGVSEGPQTLSWFLSMRINRRWCTSRDLQDDAFLFNCLRMLTLCVTEDFMRRVQQSKARECSGPTGAVGKNSATGVAASYQSTGAVALQQLLSSFSEEEARACRVFFFHGMWNRGVDDLFFCGPHYMGLSELRLKPVHPPTAVPLRVLCFPEEPHFAVAAVLRRCGLYSLNICVTQRVNFSTLKLTAEAAQLHRSIALVTPYVQTFLYERNPMLYDMTYDYLAERLQSFRVFLGCNSSLHELFWWHGVGLYAGCQHPLKIIYLAAHNTFYAEVGAYAPHVLAEAAVDLFLPLTPTSVFRLELKEMMEALFAVISSTQDAGTPGNFGEGDGGHAHFRPEAVSSDHMVEEALTVQARKLGFRPFTVIDITKQCDGPTARGNEGCTYSSIVDRTPDSPSESLFPFGPNRLLAFTVAAVPPAKHQLHFPFGCDGFSQPCGLRGGPMRTVTATTNSRSHRNCGVSIKPDGVRGALDVPAAWESAAWGSTLEARDVLLDILSPSAGTRRADEHDSKLLSCSSLATRDEAHVLVNSEPPVYNKGGEGPAQGMRRGGGEAGTVESPAQGEGEEVIHFNYSRKRARAAVDLASAMTPASFPSGVVSVEQEVSAYATAAERFVFETLKRTYKNREGAKKGDEGGVEVVWMNEHGERGTPYDIVVLRRRGSVHMSSKAAFTAGSESSWNSAQRAFTAHPSPPSHNNKIHYRQGLHSNESASTPSLYSGIAHQSVGGTLEVLAYIEVKCTSSKDRPDFELSLREFLFAAKYGSAFKVYRVFKASTSALRQMHFIVYEDLISMWFTGRLTISGDIRVLPYA